MIPTLAAELEILRTYRGVEDPCLRCRGWGVSSYASTSTWRGGIGGSAITSDVCDACWGSGDAHTKGADLRALRDEARRLSAESSSRWLETNLGVALRTLRPALLALAAEVERLGRRRKMPEGVAEYDWATVTRVLPNVVRTLCAEAEKESP